MPTPPPFPFRRTGRVIFSSRGLYGWAGFIVTIVVILGAVVVAHADRNTLPTIVAACIFLGILLAMASWCAICGLRVQRWEREYERATGRKFEAP